MDISRRDFIGGIASLSVAGIGIGIGTASASSVEVLRAATGAARLVPGDYPATPIWGYNGKMPGPVIRLRQGERLVRRFVNDLPQPSTIHWHGIRIANAMDGVPELTQPLVPPTGTFEYDFHVPDAGTYWYHPHNRTWEQLARGLYGALVVEEKEPPVVDRDEVLLIDDWRLGNDAKLEESFGAMMDWSHGGRLGNWITVNGQGDFGQTAQRHERLRLRLVNVANARIFPLSLTGLEGWIVALDGQPVSQPLPAGRMILAPAQRIDVIADVVAPSGGETALHFVDGDDLLPIARFKVDGAIREKRLPAPKPLPANPVPALGDLGKARKTVLRMEGGAMGGMRGAMMGGRMMGMRGLVGQGRVWAFNGLAEMPEKPLLSAALGETVRIEMINDTAWPHAMHLHGFHFRKLEKDGSQGPLRDTLLVDSEETAEIAFVADNPGKWLLHCHMVEHTAGGMATWIQVMA